MRVLIVFGTTEGQTKKLARFVAARLSAQHHQVVCENAARPHRARRPETFDRVLVMGSLHAGEYQSGLVRYVKAHAAELARTPSAFISVSLSAAGHERRDWQGLEACLRRFEEKTGWTPATVHQAAGAFRFRRYSFLTRFIMARIARQRGLTVDTRRDYELTDYDGLASFVAAFVNSEARPAA